MLRGGRVGEMKDMYSKVTGVRKGALKEPRFRGVFFFLRWGEGVVTLLNIGDSQIRDWEEGGEGLPFPSVFFVIFNHIPN